MPKFSFDDAKSPEENIELFINHLKTIDESLATILESNITRLTSLPEGQARTAVRTEINQQIKNALDSQTQN
ncbi:MAG TPA: hypothetical protein PK325_07500 [Cyclobacteriaceae bacterium]|nr:hypothetical protein [Cyclobacteriaceae bacterium]HMV10433.1 hypothetical protein [Cyclobacteriaceae bacterium]HMX01356.1 hypothetical protein [Cyclobacteriaceae bacterium]HMX50373.1 hypothetical protein [Cyclobacteriaceae bacterium]HMY92442.1 hypothetical protein [Cyclobacteriaceae bacterium]